MMATQDDLLNELLGNDQEKIALINLIKEQTFQSLSMLLLLESLLISKGLITQEELDKFMSEKAMDEMTNQLNSIFNKNMIGNVLEK